MSSRKTSRRLSTATHGSSTTEPLENDGGCLTSQGQTTKANVRNAYEEVDVLRLGEIATAGEGEVLLCVVPQAPAKGVWDLRTFQDDVETQPPIGRR